MVNRIGNNIFSTMSGFFPVIPSGEQSLSSLQLLPSDNECDDVELEQAIDASEESGNDAITDQQSKKHESSNVSLPSIQGFEYHTPGVLANRKRKKMEKIDNAPKAQITNRIDAIFEELCMRFNLPNCLVKTVVQYEGDIEDTIRDIRDGNKISDFVKSVAESMTVLNLAYQDHHLVIEKIRQIYGHFKNIRELTVPTDTTDGELEVINELQNLQSLNLLHCKKISDNGFGLLTNLTTLLSLKLRCIDINDDRLGSLSRIVSLESLDIRVCNGISARGIDSLARFPLLKSLTLINNSFQYNDLVYLQNHTKLQSLCLTWISNIGLSSLKTLTSLQSLTLLDVHGECIDTGLVSLKALPNLRSLYLEGSSIRDTTLSTLSNLSALKSLKLMECEMITNAGVASLSNLSALESLSLMNDKFCYRITDEIFSSLTNFPALKSLTLKIRNITDKGFSDAKQANPSIEIQKKDHK